MDSKVIAVDRRQFGQRKTRYPTPLSPLELSDVDNGMSKAGRPRESKASPKKRKSKNGTGSLEAEESRKRSWSRSSLPLEFRGIGAISANKSNRLVMRAFLPYNAPRMFFSTFDNASWVCTLSTQEEKAAQEEAGQKQAGQKQAGQKQAGQEKASQKKASQKKARLTPTGSQVRRWERVFDKVAACLGKMLEQVKCSGKTLVCVEILGLESIILGLQQDCSQMPIPGQSNGVELSKNQAWMSLTVHRALETRRACLLQEERLKLVSTTR